MHVQDGQAVRLRAAIDGVRGDQRPRARHVLDDDGGLAVQVTREMLSKQP